MTAQPTSISLPFLDLIKKIEASKGSVESISIFYSSPADFLSTVFVTFRGSDTAYRAELSQDRTVAVVSASKLMDEQAISNLMSSARGENSDIIGVSMDLYGYKSIGKKG